MEATNQNATKTPQEVPTPKVPVYLGLCNQGATCYMNSLLQTLFMTHEFRRALFKWEYKEEEHGKQEDCIPYQLLRLFSKLQLCTVRKAIDTKSLIKSFQWESQDAFQQHDVQEFCRVLFDAIEESFRDTPQESLIRDLYEGISTEFVKCRSCKNETNREAKFLDLSLTVKNDFDQIFNDSVECALKNYLKPDILELDNQYFCETCNKKVDAEKGVRFLKFPKILTLQLNRFELDYMTLVRRKINNKVTFPHVLNVNEFMKEFSKIDSKGLEGNKTGPAMSNEENLKEKYKEIQKRKAIETPVKKKVGSQARTFEDLEKKKSEIHGSLGAAKKFQASSPRAAKSTFDLDPPRKTVTESEKNILDLESLRGLKEDKKLLDSKMKNITFAKKPTKERNLFPDLKPIDEDDILFDPLFSNNFIFDSPQDNVSVGLNSTQDSELKPDPVPDLDQDTISMNKIIEEQIATYLTDGPFVYELYSIMMHQGSAMGGHYYSYIKSFETKTWYKFNDSFVGPVKISELNEAFGEDLPRLDWGKSAYMLFYRLFEESDNLNSFRPEVPEFVKDVVVKEDEEQKKKADEEERARVIRENLLTFKVFYNKNERVIMIDKRETYTDLKERVKEEFPVVEDDADWRLRIYSFFEQTMQETFTGQEKKTVEQLNILHKNLIVETKRPQDQFSEYDPNKITVKINLWRSGLTSLEEKDLDPDKILISEKKCLLDLMEEIETRYGIPQKSQLILRRKPCLNTTFSEVVNNMGSTFDKTLSYHSIFNGLNLFVETIDSDYEKTLQSKWDREFELEKFRCLVKFNNPQDDKSTCDSYQIYMDTRDTVHNLKQKIAEILQIDPDQFILKRESKLGMEIKDLESKLVDNNFVSRCSLFLEIGTPSQFGEFRIKICLGGISPLKSDSISYEWQDLFELQIKLAATVREVKQRIYQEILRQRPEITNIDPTKMRLREKNTDKFGQVLHNNSKMKEYALYDKKSIALEILDDVEETSSEDLLIFFKSWDITTLELSQPYEIFVKKRNSLHEVMEAILQKGKFSIEREHVYACKINALWSFSRSSLPQETWVKLHNNTSPIEKAPWYCIRDGSLIIIRDESLAASREININSLKESEKVDDKGAKPKEDKWTKPKEKALVIKVKKQVAAKDDFETSSKKSKPETETEKRRCADI